MVFRSAGFAGTYHRILVATLKIRFKSRRMASTSKVYWDVGRLRDDSVAQEYNRKRAESSNKLVNSDDTEKLWNDYKKRIIKVSETCLQGTPRMSKSFLTKQTLKTIEKIACLDEYETGQHRKLKR